MADILKATAQSNKVKAIVDGKEIEIPGTQILSQGTGASSGVVFMVKGERVYLNSSSDDISSFIDIIVNLISVLSSGILAANAGGNITAPTFASDLQNISQTLNNLKGNLQ